MVTLPLMTTDFSDDTLSIASGGLAAHYTFDGDATDQSGNSNDGTVEGAVLTTDRFGKSNSAYYFDGENDKIKVPFTESLKIEDDITLNLWVNNEETGYETDFLLRSPNGYYAIEIHERDNDKSYQPYARGGGSWNNIHPQQNYKNTWNMVTFTSKVKYDEDGEKLRDKEYSIYVDGVR